MDLTSTGIDHASRTHASLLLRVRDPGDHQAWAEFERRYRPMIEGWCRRWFPRETEDRVQDVYCKLVGRLRTFEYDPARGRFRGWLKTLTNRLMADLKRAPHPDLPVDESVLEQAEAGQDLFERLAAEYDLELLEMVKEHVQAQVTKQTWWIYVETAERGRDPAEVARELDMAVGAVYQARYRVSSALRREIEIREGLS
jgi:RNA polymerase sigma factor (sigma-70 family)